jgi:SanA protein
MWFVLGVIALVVLFAGVLVCWGIHRAVVAGASKRIYTLNQDIPRHKVALVLGARVYSDGRLSAMLKDRVDAGIELYRKGVVQKLLMSGDNRHRNYNEVTAMRNYAIKQGIPTDDVVRDFAGFRTYDSIYRAKMLWDLEDMIIVSQKFHLPRSLYIARKLGIDAVGVSAADYKYRSLYAASRREVAARIVAWLDVLIGRDPYFLGPKETLSGDSQKTMVPE